MPSMTHAPRSCRRLPTTSAAVSLGAAAAIALSSSQVLAQECPLGVRAAPNVIYAGQSAGVDLLAHFPSNMYALASARFDVHATLPAWTFASSGVVAGSDVLGMDVWQTHAPQTGTFADPANPFPVWRGAFTPNTSKPVLVEIAADPSAMAVYPNRLTPSWVPGVARGDSDWILVNPLPVGRWVAAPGPGTQVHTGDDVIVDGRIIIGENPAGPVRIGLLLPAVQKVGESVMRVCFDDRPESFAATVDLPTLPGEQLALNFTRADWPPAGNERVYRLSADLGSGDRTPIRFEGFLGGVRVAAGELDSERAPLWVDRVPEEIRVGARPVRTRGGYQLETVLVSSYQTGGHASAPARLFLANGSIIEIDRLRVRATRAASSNNLKQLGLGCHVLEASGVRSMTVVPVQPPR